MSEFKGTKGVWKLEFNHKPKRTRLEVNAYPNPNRPELKENLYSYILDEEQCSVSGCGCIIEEEANAKLIACAPEMLEMLYELYNDKETFSDLFASQQFKIIQLIKKATS